MGRPERVLVQGVHDHRSICWDVAAAIVHLAEQVGITGEVIEVDAGLHLYTTS